MEDGTATANKILAVIVAMPAIITVLLTLWGSLWLRSGVLVWRLFLFSLSGSLPGAIVGCIIGYSIGYNYEVTSGNEWVWGMPTALLGILLGWAIGAVVGGLVGLTVFWSRL